MTRQTDKTEDKAPAREMVELVDPAGQPFSTGHLATVNSLLMNGYSLKSGTLADAQDKLAPQQEQVTAEGGGKAATDKAPGK